jgi:hypothetical protein
MHRTPQSLTDIREELVQIQEEFTRLQKRIETVRDCVTDSLVRFFGEQRPAFTGLQEEELIEKLAGRVAARLGTLLQSLRHKRSRNTSANMPLRSFSA